MFTESACQDSRRWDDVGRFYTRLFGVVYVTRGEYFVSVKHFLRFGLDLLNGIEPASFQLQFHFRK
jgi:hypothetical protein